MAFNQTINAERYVKGNSPLLETSHKTYLETELRNISKAVESLVSAIEEIQTYLKTLP